MGLILDTPGLVHAEVRSKSFVLFDDFGKGFSIELDKEALPHLLAAVQALVVHAQRTVEVLPRSWLPGEQVVVQSWWPVGEQERIDAWEAARRLDPAFEREVEQLEATVSGAFEVTERQPDVAATVNERGELLPTERKRASPRARKKR